MINFAHGEGKLYSQSGAIYENVLEQKMEACSWSGHFHAPLDQPE